MNLALKNTHETDTQPPTKQENTIIAVTVVILKTLETRFWEESTNEDVFIWK